MVCRMLRHYCLRKSLLLLVELFMLNTRQISSPSSAEGTARNGGGYDVVPYRYFGYPKVAKNMLEMDRPKDYALTEANPVAERVLRPRYLCFLRDKGRPAMITNVDEWYFSLPNPSTLVLILIGLPKTIQPMAFPTSSSHILRNNSIHRKTSESCMRWPTQQREMKE